MKKYYLCILFFLALFLNICSAQTGVSNNLRKYWFYRQRLLNTLLKLVATFLMHLMMLELIFLLIYLI